MTDGKDKEIAQARLFLEQANCQLLEVIKAFDLSEDQATAIKLSVA